MGHLPLIFDTCKPRADVEAGTTKDEPFDSEPGCPYPRGRNGNTKGLIRQFYPKGTNFRDVNHYEVRATEKLLNDRAAPASIIELPTKFSSEDSACGDGI